MMFDNPLKQFFRPPAAVEMPPESGVIEIHARLVPVLFRRHPRARRYLLSRGSELTNGKFGRFRAIKGQLASRQGGQS
jgi:hypothetical protein